MADLNWCTSCDNAVSPFSDSLYCSEQCLRTDALRNHPLLGYTYPEFTDFPRPRTLSNVSSASTSPALTASSQSSSPPKFDLSSHSYNKIHTPKKTYSPFFS
ncbi:hypothetical protein INT47_000096 [Mucor saturninus]|uniref:Uncharacterized protein n=1 Tax=Mucor saturninus TaxID=64648 RepID=A0A8H7VDX5_9FUNG|nr:hypothetical protein INT47_000096 [Mucor saturninus]